jgi:hypothetical protein
MAPPADRPTFRALVAAVAAKAKAKLPQAVNGRIESAVKLVLQGDVEPQADGSIQVGSSDPTRWYALVGSTCTCTDFVQGKSPEGWCKHRIAAGIQKRVRELLTAPSAPAASTAAESPGLPEAPASANCHITIAGRQVQLTLRDRDESRLLERLAVVLEKYPVPQAAAQRGPTPGQGQEWCQIHNVKLHLNHGKDGRTWLSHRLPEGGFCKGRP